MRVAVTSPFFHLMPFLKEEILKQYPDSKFKESFPPFSGDELVEFCQGCEGAVIGLDRFDDEVLSRLPELKVIGVCSAGADHIDPAAMKKYGKRMGWVAGINKIAVAEMTISHMINILRNFHKFSRQALAGDWPSRREGTLLHGKTVGIHGCGNIGKEVAKRLIPFGVEILASDKEDYSDFYQEYGITGVEPEELWARSDVLTIHMSRNQKTIGMYSAEVLDKLKPGVFIINTARGRMFDETALYERLKSGHIKSAAFDVFEIEPPIDTPLFELENFYPTPHTVAGAKEAWEAMARSGIKGLTENWIPEPGVYPYD
jgi:D-3-phosphoglycerate dehydrogenase / 2-oxoglutarate reductase